MPRNRLLALLVGALLPLALAPAAHADDPVIALDVIVDHDVVWDYVDGDPSDDCHAWTKGSGTQSIRVRTDRRERLRLERAFGSVMLTGRKPGTFYGTVDRIGKWKEHIGRGNVEGCSPCGPDSEYGRCDEEDLEQPKPLKFDCGERELKRPTPVISMLGTKKGIPSLEQGLGGMVYVRREVTFPNCPPSLPRGHETPTLQAEWPERVELDRADTARITKLQPGDSVVAEVLVQRSYVDTEGKVTKGKRCAGAPDITSGYSECAVTSYSFTFTRLSYRPW